LGGTFEFRGGGGKRRDIIVDPRGGRGDRGAPGKPGDDAEEPKKKVNVGPCKKKQKGEKKNY